MEAPHEMELIGVDGCRGGWLIASLHGPTVVARLDVSAADLVGIDMPIGLPEHAARACDRAARAFLGPRRSSVFPAPARACIGATDYADALQRGRAALGVGLSVQAYNLLAKITELDALVGPDDDDRVVEVHPECAFHVMNEMEPLPAKRTAAGARRRTELLTARFGTLPATPPGAARDDLLDAYAVLWSTTRFAERRHIEFGDGSRDRRNLPMRIVC